MICFSEAYDEAYDEEKAEREFPKDSNLETEEVIFTNGLGFLGGPAWHYPEEEIEFSTVDEVEGQHGMEENGANKSCSGSSTDNLRMAMIENYIGTHDIYDDDDDLFYVCNINIDYALSQPSPLAPITVRDSENKESAHDIDDDDDYNAYACNSSNNDGLPHTFPIAPNKKRHTWTSNSSTTKIRTHDEDSSSSDTTANNEHQLYRFREAALCVPFEYKTKLATFYIRRPYGIITVPERFQVLSPHTTDEEYKKRSRVSSSQTIQVAIAISADNSSMLLYGSAGVRYKTDPSDVQCGNWTDVPDVGAMDFPLGYVNNETHNTWNHNIEYSLDEILEEAMLVREQYCSTILSAALEVEQDQLQAIAKTPSLPSLAKSIVSTPPRTNYYYDGSSNNIKVEGEQEDMKCRKLDFLQCISPSLMTKGSYETTSTQPRHSGSQQRQRKRRRRRFYRFCQRVIIIVGFYCCGIFLVANLSAVDYHRSSTVVAELLPPSYKTVFANNLVSWMFLNNVEEQHQHIKGTNGDEKSTKDFVPQDDSSRLFQIAEFFAATTINERIKSDCSASIEIMTDKSNSYKRKLETTQMSLREQVEQNNGLFKKNNSERTKIEKLQEEKEDAVTSVLKLRHEIESLTVDLEIEQGQRGKLEEIIREFEIQIMTLKQEKSPMKHATDSCTLITSVEMINSKVSLEDLMLKDARNSKKELEKLTIESRRFETLILEEQYNTKEYQVQQQQQQPSGKESSEAIIVDFLDITKSVGENRSLQEEEDLIDEKEQLIAADKLLLTPPKNKMQSIENFILKSARANKGPIFPIMYRHITKRFSRQFVIDEAHGRRGYAFTSHNKIEVFASSVRDTITHNVKKIVRGRQHVGDDDVEIADLSRMNRLAFIIDSVAEKEAKLVRKARSLSTENLTVCRENLKNEVSNALANIVQSIRPKFVNNSMEMKEKLKSSTDKVLKQSKESSEMLRRQVKKNVDEVSTAGIRKLDRGQKSINVIGNFAKVKLKTVGKRVSGFARKKLRQRRSLRS